MNTALAILFSSCAPLVHPVTLQALIGVESAGRPYAVSINRVESLEAAGRSVPVIDPQPATLDEALSLSRALLAQGYTLSVGLAQINTEHLPRLRRAGSARSLADLFDPCTNLRAAQGVLLECRAQGLGGRDALAHTLSCYNSGHPTLGLRNGYVLRVIRKAYRLTAVPTAGAMHAEPQHHSF